jgi:hypothetical protein
MASAVRKLTGVGGDIRKIARLLQKEAPPGHMLAYINQEEADLLKARGGSGKPHADTGVPSFEMGEEYTDFDTPMPGETQATNRAFESARSEGESGASPSIRSYLPSYTEGAESGASVGLGGGAVPMTDASSGYYRPYYADPVAPEAVAPVSAEGTASLRDALATPRETGARESFDTSTIAPGGSEAPTTKIDKGIGDEVKDWWKTLKPDTKARLGIGGIEAIIGAYQTNQAMEQARKYREDIAKTAQPYQQQGKELIAKAQSGELSPAAQQTLQAAQAQAAQGAQTRGGVGAQQAQAQVEGLRQQLLQQQYDYGLKVLGIGDQIAVGAIKAGMQADSYVNQLASNYTMNIARTLAGTPTYVNLNAPIKE